MLGMWDLAQARAGAWTWEKLVLARCMALGKLFLLYDLVVLVFFFLIYLNYSLSSYPCVCPVGGLPLSSTNRELGAECSLAPNLLGPGAGTVRGTPA